MLACTKYPDVQFFWRRHFAQILNIRKLLELIKANVDPRNSISLEYLSHCMVLFYIFSGSDWTPRVSRHSKKMATSFFLEHFARINDITPFVEIDENSEFRVNMNHKAWIMLILLLYIDRSRCFSNSRNNGIDHYFTCLENCAENDLDEQIFKIWYMVRKILLRHFYGKNCQNVITFYNSLKDLICKRTNVIFHAIDICLEGKSFPYDFDFLSNGWYAEDHDTFGNYIVADDMVAEDREKVEEAHRLRKRNKGVSMKKKKTTLSYSKRKKMSRKKTR